MKYIVVDLECLQPGNEIIQIGAVTWDSKRGISYPYFNSVANPGKLPDDYKLRNGQTITELTGITAEQVANAAPLADVLAAWWAYVAMQYCGTRICTWGAGDLPLLTEQSKACGVHYPARIRHLNLKPMAELFRDNLRGTKLIGGLANTLDSMDLVFCGKQHNAKDDAYNTALLLQRFSDLIKLGMFTRQMAEDF